MVIHSKQTYGWIRYACPNNVTVESLFKKKLNSAQFYLIENKLMEILEYSIFYKFLRFKEVKKILNITINGKITPITFIVSKKIFNMYIEFNIDFDVYHIIYQTSFLKSIHKNGKQIGLISINNQFNDSNRTIEFDDNINYQIILAIDTIVIIEFNEFFENYSAFNIALPYKAKAIYKMEENWKPNQP